MKTALLLEIVPAFHGDLTGVEFAFAAVTGFVGALLLARGLTSVSPAEIVKVPKRVDWQDKVPDWQREQVDQHPDDVTNAVRGDDNEDRGKPENQGKENKWDDRRCGVFYSRFDRYRNC